MHIELMRTKLKFPQFLVRYIHLLIFMAWYLVKHRDNFTFYLT